MKGLSLIEPWASLVAFGLKKVETRSWYASYRGPVAIHASKSRVEFHDPERIEQLFAQAGVQSPEGWPKSELDFPFGKIVAVAKIESCVEMNEALIQSQTQAERAFGAWAPGRFAWILGEVRRIQYPVPCKGALGLWDVPEAIRGKLE